MKIVNFFRNFLIIFFIFGFCLLFRLDYHFYTRLTFHLFKPSLSFFQIFNLVYAFLISLSLSEIISLYHFKDLSKSFFLKFFINLSSFMFIRFFFNFHYLLFTFLSSLSLFISLLYLYEEISYLNEKSTKYLDINVLYSLLLSAFTFCLYVLNCS